MEGIATAIDRGGLKDRGRITRVLRTAPHGKAAADLEQAIEVVKIAGPSST